MTGIELVLEVAREYGFVEMTEESADHILWEHTGFPAFYPPGFTAEAHFRNQLHDYFASVTEHKLGAQDG